jgi:hypothetical protein
MRISYTHEEPKSSTESYSWAHHLPKAVQSHPTTNRIQANFSTLPYTTTEQSQLTIKLDAHHILKGIRLCSISLCRSHQ